MNEENKENILDVEEEVHTESDDVSFEEVNEDVVRAMFEGFDYGVQQCIDHTQKNGRLLRSELAASLGEEKPLKK